MTDDSKMSGIQSWIHGYVESSRLTKVAVGFQELCGVRQGKPHNWLLHYTFTALTHLGSEEAYGAILPLLLWFCGGSIARETMFCWMLLFAGGQFLKDVFRLPRPLASSVTVLNHTFSQEYGFPSTHTMSAMTFSFFILLLAINSYERTFGHPDDPSPHVNSGRSPSLWGDIGVPFAISLLYPLCMSLSRLYFGVHSIADLVGGFALSFLGLFSLTILDYAFIFFPQYQENETVDPTTHIPSLTSMSSSDTFSLRTWLLTSPVFIACCYGTLFSLLSIYPTPQHTYSPSPALFASVSSASMGMILSFQIMFFGAPHSPLLLTALETLQKMSVVPQDEEAYWMREAHGMLLGENSDDMVGRDTSNGSGGGSVPLSTCVFCVLIGYTALVIFQVLFSKVYHFLFRAFFIPNFKTKTLTKKELNHMYRYEIVRKFISYTFVTMLVAIVCPLFWRYLRLL